MRDKTGELINDNLIHDGLNWKPLQYYEKEKLVKTYHFERITIT